MFDIRARWSMGVCRFDCVARTRERSVVVNETVGGWIRSGLSALPAAFRTITEAKTQLSSVDFAKLPAVLFDEAQFCAGQRWRVLGARGKDGTKTGHLQRLAPSSLER